MSAEIKAASGQGWARAAVVVGAVLSVAGNATETVLTSSPVNLAIRIVLATFLPVIVFIAVEVFVRVAWRRKLMDIIGRAMLIVLPALGAAYVSFGHLYNLSTRSGADWIAASANALAIDGLMIGGTVALLAIRAARLAEQAPVAPDIDLDATLKKWTVTPAELGSFPPPPELIEPAPASISVVTRRAPRGQTAESMRDAVMALLDGMSVKEAAEKFGVPPSSLGRYHTLRRKLAAAAPGDHEAIIADSKTRPDLAEFIATKAYSPEGAAL
jgi:transposase-like protein